MRTLGAAVLGLFGGLVAGLLLTEVVARLAVGPGGDLRPSLPLALLLGFAPLVLAAVGAALGVVLERRREPGSRRPPAS